MLYRSATDPVAPCWRYRQRGQSYIEFSFSGACGNIAATLTVVRWMEPLRPFVGMNPLTYSFLRKVYDHTLSELLQTELE